MNPATYAQAVRFAVAAHDGQVRKGSNTPYIGHPMAVSALVIQYGGDEDQAVAALLHDVVEDCGVSLDFLAGAFGDKVADIVDAATDGVPDATGRKLAWKERKEAYIAGVPAKAAEALLVVACDKVHNAEAIVADFAEVGAEVFDRFTAGPKEVAWYYAALAYELCKRDLPLGLKWRLTQAAGKIKTHAALAEMRPRQACAA